MRSVRLVSVKQKLHFTFDPCCMYRESAEDIPYVVLFRDMIASRFWNIIRLIFLWGTSEGRKFLQLEY